MSIKRQVLQFILGYTFFLLWHKQVQPWKCHVHATEQWNVIACVTTFGCTESYREEGPFVHRQMVLIQNMLSLIQSPSVSMLWLTHSIRFALLLSLTCSVIRVFLCIKTSKPWTNIKLSWHGWSMLIVVLSRLKDLSVPNIFISWTFLHQYVVAEISAVDILNPKPKAWTEWKGSFVKVKK